MVNKSTDIINTAAEHMSELMLNMLNAQSKEHGLDVSKDTAVKFIESFVALFLFRTLSERVGGSTEERFKHAYKSYAGAKFGIQEAIGLAFSNSMYAFTGKEVDYYCKVQIAQEPPTRELC